MAHESSVRVGSGVSVLREGLVPGYTQALPGLRGTNSVVINYEDIESKIGIVQASGVAVDGDAVHVAGPLTRLRGRRQLMIQNLSSDAVYVGDSTVTVGDGLRIAQNETLTLHVLDVGNIYVVGDGSSDVRVLELK